MNWSVVPVPAVPGSMAAHASMAANTARQLATALVSLALVLSHWAASLAAAAAHNTVRLVVRAWTSKRAERIRKKIYWEVALALLGPGLTLLLVVLWPGWLVLALAAAVEAVWGGR